MKTFTHLFTSEIRLKSFLSDNNIDASKKVFIQVFTAINSAEYLQNILNIIHALLPLSSVIATSTAGEIAEGGLLENTTTISFSIFECTDVYASLFEGDTVQDIADKITRMITSSTKLLIAFNNVYSNDGEELLIALEEKLPNIIIAGGNAADYGDFIGQTVVGANSKVSTTGVAVALFYSEQLQVFNNHLFNWQTIGESMTITKSVNSIIYEINHQKAYDVYKHFLGDEVAKELPLSGVEFPLVYAEDDISIARAPVAIGDSGEIIMAGHIKEGTIVKFGFGDISLNDKDVIKTLEQFAQHPIESIFIYSCSARKYFLKEHLNNEFELLQQIAPTVGFITYGEFFKHNQCTKMLNVSSTFIGLSENSQIVNKKKFDLRPTTASTRTLSALTHLVKQTSKHLEEKNNTLKQFQHIIKESTLYSTTNTKGIITDVNDKFVVLSGYSKEELIGMPHNIIRHSEMPSSVYKEMWTTLKDKKAWKGIVKNKAKNGETYYVRSHIFPILDSDNKILEYVSLRDDITDEIEKKLYLEGTVNALEEITKDKEYLLNQYEKVINLSSSFFRIDSNYNFTYVNDVFCNIYHCSIEDMINKNITDILESTFIQQYFNAIHNMLLENGDWVGIVPFQRDDNSIVHMNTSVNTIFDNHNNIVEYMVVLHDITDLIVAQDEITKTQRDVVYTMGAIGESRSRETGNHVKRVAEYSKVLALHYGLALEEAELLKMASPMHDIGKVAIPDAILNKPGKFTEDEWEIMKTHSLLGYEMLKDSKREILQASAIVAKTHHEQWDGNGYPDSLRGEEIHIYGRITAIADVFDALGSDRCYKKAWEDEKIFELIRNGREKHFDPTLVDIFFEHLDIFLDIRAKFKD